MGYLETGRPDSTSDKQTRDHKKSNRLAKDAIDLTRVSKNERSFMKTMLSIFTITSLVTYWKRDA